MHSNIESYSAFWDYAKSNETPLRKSLKARNVMDVYVCGIATDFCVGKYSMTLTWFSCVFDILRIQNYAFHFNMLFFPSESNLKY